MHDKVEANMMESMSIHPYFALGPRSQNWQGIEAVLANLSVPPREFYEDAAPLYWPQTTVILQAAGRPTTVQMEEGRVWRNFVSRPGDLMFAPIGIAKRIIWSDPATNLSMSVDPHLISMVATEMIKGDPSQLTFRPAGQFKDALLAQIGFSVTALLNDSAADTQLYGESLGVTLTHHLIYHHAKRQKTGATPQALSKSGLKRTLDHIHTHYNTRLSLHELADSAGMSVAHFSRLFRQATGKSPYQYLIHLRCEKACELLAAGRYTVTEVAHEVGFFDHSHFIRHFRQQYRVTPRQWLAQHK